jgi:hypothetical protein
MPFRHGPLRAKTGEAREHLLGRTDEIRTADKRAGKLALERDALQTRIADLEVAATAAKQRRQAFRLFQIIDVFHAPTLRHTREASILFLCNQDWQQAPKAL